MFTQLVTIEPLGLLYGSAGRFLSPENLVGRSGTSFPPSAATLSGLFAAAYGNAEIQNLQLAGPFWAWNENPQNFRIPTPFNCLVRNKVLRYVMAWYQGKWCVWSKDNQQWKTPPNDKFDRGTWMAIEQWELAFKDAKQSPSIEVESSPWKAIPHLHPRLKEDERRVAEDLERGSLFLENGIQFHPDACLVYLSNIQLNNGWHRFGGEGHIVDVQCKPLAFFVQELLSQPVRRSFAIITPAVWGSNRLSYREPRYLCKGKQNAARHSFSDPDNDLQKIWSVEAMLAERPIPYRYRLGNRIDDQKQDSHQPHQPKLLSRGRYAVPAGTVYITEEPQLAWANWSENWFPKEGPSLKRWGCGLALPLPRAIAASDSALQKEVTT